MIERFEVGEVAIFCRPGANRCGTEVTITGGLKRRTFVDWQDGVRKCEPVYEISGPVEKLRYGGRAFCARPQHLRKKRPPREAVGTWDHCVWKPKLEV